MRVSISVFSLLRSLRQAMSSRKEDEMEVLKARIKQLELELRTRPVRMPIETMDAKVVDSNPYRSVLSALVHLISTHR